MKTIIYIFFICCFSYSCQELEKVDNPKLEVSTDKKTYKVGEPILFKFDKAPDFVTFYSGTIGNDYSYKTTSRVDNFDLVMSLTHQLAAIPANKVWQKDHLSILYSEDFNGVYTIEDINKGTWHEIEGFNYLEPTQGGNTEFTPLDPVGVNHILGNSDKKELYFAVRYTVKNQNENGVATWVRVQNLKIEGIKEDQTTELFKYTNTEWKLTIVPDKEEVVGASRSSLDAAWITFRANRINLEVETVDWAISPKVELAQRIDFGPDWGVNVKSLSNADVVDYTFEGYDTPGEYRVVFEGINVNAINGKTITQEIVLTIEP